MRSRFDVTGPFSLDLRSLLGQFIQLYRFHDLLRFNLIQALDRLGRIMDRSRDIDLLSPHGSGDRRGSIEAGAMFVLEKIRWRRNALRGGVMVSAKKLVAGLGCQNQPKLIAVSISPPIIGAVHLWQARWPDELQPNVLEAARFLLNPVEQQRADRFHFERDRRRFTWARAMLKWVLSRYLNCDASAIELVALNHGKPTLPAAGNPEGIEFNLSHSGNRVAIAFASKTPVGVDIEWMERLRDWQALANTIFSEQELAELAGLPESRRVQGFFNGWTRKEAYLKAIGIGLIDDLKSIVVSLDPAMPARLIQAQTASEQSGEWLLHSFAPDEGYAGALAIQNPSAHVEEFTFSPETFSRSAG